jgi:hypothetical protein
MLCFPAETPAHQREDGFLQHGPGELEAHVETQSRKNGEDLTVTHERLSANERLACSLVGASEARTAAPGTLFQFHNSLEDGRRCGCSLL